MVELGGQTLIGRQLRTLELCGLNDISILTGYYRKKIEALGYPTIANPEWKTTNMVSTLWCSFDKLKEDIIIAYADIIYQQNVLKTLLASDADISIVVDRSFRKYWEFRFKDPLEDVESLVISSDGCIQSIGQKVKSMDEVEAQYIGLMRFKGKGLRTLKKHMTSISKTKRFASMYMTDLLQDIANNGECLKAVTVANGWLEIDSVNDYLAAKKRFKDGSINEFFNPMK